ncbi:hypothetical protein [Chitinophaga sp. YIM B06452]|uniref:hypothetical protein n=1 Tax=Chitinophaga sp. YIM B06452 TaxID=3082158 RepID=UPI0031FE9B0F
MRLVRVKWDPMPRSTAYQYQYREVGTNVWSAMTSGGMLGIDGKVYVDLLLEVGKSYEFRVRNVCPGEITGWSLQGINVYSNDGACLTPTGVTVEQLPGTYNFRISWDNASNATSWNFRYRRQGDLTWISSVQNTPAITLSNLIIGATYEYQVQTICSGATVSDWGNIGTLQVRSSTATQDCPIAYEEDWTGTINGGKDSANTVKLNGELEFTGSVFPEEDSYTEAGSVGQCCAPLTDIVILVDNAQFKGEITITSSGQIIVYVEDYVAASAIEYTFANFMYQGSAGTCPPPVPPNPGVTGIVSFGLTGSNFASPIQMDVTFSGPTTQGISFKWGACVRNTSAPQLPDYCTGYTGEEAQNATQATIGIGTSHYQQFSTIHFAGYSYGLLLKIVIWDIHGISPAELQKAVGENYELIFL